MSEHRQHLRGPRSGVCVCLAALLLAACDAAEPAKLAQAAPVSPARPVQPAGPSFDCAAATPVEKEVCRDPGLAGYEQETAGALKAALAAAPTELQAALRDSQRAFLAYADALCRRQDGYAPGCLRRAYVARTGDLDSTVTEDGFGRTFVAVVEYEGRRAVQLSQIFRPASAAERRWNAAAAERLARFQAEFGADEGDEGSTFSLYPMTLGPDFISAYVEGSDRRREREVQEFHWVLAKGRELEAADLFADPAAAFDSLARIAAGRAEGPGAETPIKVDVPVAEVRAVVADLHAWSLTDGGVEFELGPKVWTYLEWADLKPYLRKDPAVDVMALKSLLG